MIRFIKWVFISIFATLFFPLIGILGFFIGQIKYLFQKGIKGYFNYLIDMVGGLFVGLSHILEGYSLGLDIMANSIGGEGLEWLFSKNYSKDVSTLMGDPNATISAGIGDMKHKKHLSTKFGLFVDRCLNKVFNQKNHSEYARLYHKAKQDVNKLIEPYN